MKTLFRLIPVLAAVLLVASSCTGDPFMNDYHPNYPPGSGGNGSGNGGNGGTQNPAVKFEVNRNWQVSYNGREMSEGAQVDRIVVKSSDNNAYYLDLISEASFREDFSGSVSDYAKAVREGLAATLQAEGGSWNGLLSVRDSYVLFDRLRAGRWMAFAIGFDSGGSLTGKYAVLEFSIDEEKPTAEFSNWLGTWRMGGRDLDGNQVSYTVVLSSSEANYAYWLSGWEPTGSFDGMEYEFEVYYNPENNRLEFNSLYFETVEAKDEFGVNREYEVCLNGNFRYNGQYWYVNEDVALADGFISEDGRHAEVRGCGITVEMDRGVTFETTFTSMQMMYVPVLTDSDDRLGRSPLTYVFNENVPQFPLQMEWLSASTQKVRSKAAPVRLSVPRKARRHGAGAVISGRPVPSRRSCRTSRGAWPLPGPSPRA